jgi:hypothetical protein
MQKFLFGCCLAILVSLAGTFVVHAVIVPPSKTVTLTWNYSQPSSNIVFNVYGTTNLSVPCSKWGLLTNSAATSCVVPAPDDVHFYTVTASNVVTGMESPR